MFVLKLISFLFLFIINLNHTYQYNQQLQQQQLQQKQFQLQQQQLPQQQQQNYVKMYLTNNKQPSNSETAARIFLKRHRHHHNHISQQNHYQQHHYHQRKSSFQHPDYFDTKHTNSLTDYSPLRNWNCDFEIHDCGIGNQYNMGSYFVLRTNLSQPLFGKSGMMFLDVSNAKSSGARLITQYFPANGCQFACLTIEYLLCGNAPKSLYIIQQDKKNYCVLQVRNTRAQGWANSSVTIDLSNGSPRFFIEAHFDCLPPKYGSIAISNMAFTYGKCCDNQIIDENIISLNDQCDVNNILTDLNYGYF